MPRMAAEIIIAIVMLVFASVHTVCSAPVPQRTISALSASVQMRGSPSLNTSAPLRRTGENSASTLSVVVVPAVLGTPARARPAAAASQSDALRPRPKTPQPGSDRERYDSGAAEDGVTADQEILIYPESDAADSVSREIVIAAGGVRSPDAISEETEGKVNGSRILWHEAVSMQYTTETTGVDVQKSGQNATSSASPDISSFFSETTGKHAPNGLQQKDRMRNENNVNCTTVSLSNDVQYAVLCMSNHSEDVKRADTFSDTTAASDLAVTETVQTLADESSVNTIPETSNDSPGATSPLSDTGVTKFLQTMEDEGKPKTVPGSESSATPAGALFPSPGPGVTRSAQAMEDDGGAVPAPDFETSRTPVDALSPSLDPEVTASGHAREDERGATFVSDSESSATRADVLFPSPDPKVTESVQAMENERGTTFVSGSKSAGSQLGALSPSPDLEVTESAQAMGDEGGSKPVLAYETSDNPSSTFSPPTDPGVTRSAQAVKDKGTLWDGTSTAVTLILPPSADATFPVNDTIGGVAAPGATVAGRWAGLAVAVVVFLTVLSCVVYRRRRRDTANMSGPAGTSPWAKPAPPALPTTDARAGVDAVTLRRDESFDSPPPTYRAFMGVGATNAPSVSLDMEELDSSGVGSANSSVNVSNGECS